jgi:hypothetical protein
MDRFKILLSGIFFVYLIFNGFSSSNYISFYLAGILVIGLIWEWVVSGKVNLIPRVSSIPPQDNRIFLLLSELMRKNGLEMRLRMTENYHWNVSFIKHMDGITRIMGKGSAPLITEAIMRAEGDFEKRDG